MLTLVAVVVGLILLVNLLAFLLILLTLGNQHKATKKLEEISDARRNGKP